jgi:predicted MFS family arabinose efflux permease
MDDAVAPEGAPGAPLSLETGRIDAAPPAPHRLPALWRNRDYMLLWSGQTVSALGGSMSAVVFPLLILALTNSPLAAGIAGALASIPCLIFSLPVGALIDRWDRKRVMILCDAGRALSLASVPVAMVFGVLTVWQLYLNAFIEGSLFVFFNIAEVAALTRVVGKAQLPAATAQNEATWGLAGLLGPPLGGFLYQVAGRGVPFLFDAVSYTVSVVSLFFIRTEFQAERGPAARRHLRAEIQEGVRWLWRHRLFRFMAFAAGAMNFAFAASTLVIIVIARNLGGDSTSIGTIFSLAALGGLAGSLLGGRIQNRFRFGQVVVATVWIEALLFPLYAVAPHILVLGLITAAIFFTVPIFNVVVLSYRLALVPDALQGRVNSAARLIVFGFQPLGSALGGVLIERLGTAGAVGVFAAWLVGLAILVGINPHVRQAPPLDEALRATSVQV